MTTRKKHNASWPQEYEDYIRAHPHQTRKQMADFLGVSVGSIQVLCKQLGITRAARVKALRAKPAMSNDARDVLREQQKALILAALEGGRKGRMEIAQATGLDAVTCTNRLNQLKALGRVKCVAGSAGGRAWILAPKEEWLEVAPARKPKTEADSGLLWHDIPAVMQRLLGYANFTPPEGRLVEEEMPIIKPAKRSHYAGAGSSYQCSLA